MLSKIIIKKNLCFRWAFLGLGATQMRKKMKLSKKIILFFMVILFFVDCFPWVFGTQCRTHNWIGWFSLGQGQVYPTTFLCQSFHTNKILENKWLYYHRSTAECWWFFSPLVDLNDPRRSSSLFVRLVIKLFLSFVALCSDACRFVLLWLICCSGTADMKVTDSHCGRRFYSP